MKVKDVMSGVLTVILWIAISGLCAQQPQIDISLANSLGIPHAYDDVIKLESGDLQFYKMTATNGSIQITGFQYLRQSNALTNVVQIGNITGIEGTAYKEFSTQRFGRYYALYQYQRYDPQGLVIIRLDAHDLEYRIIDNIQISEYFNGQGRFDIVSENHFVIALEDRLEFYDLASGTSQTLLDGEDYQGNSMHDKRVYAVPTGHFMYVMDKCEDDAVETWFIFDSQGTHQFTKFMTDPWFGRSVTGYSFEQDFDLVHDRFYIPLYGLEHDSTLLECHFPSPDSLHYYIVDAPVSFYETLGGLVKFGDDRVLMPCFDYNPCYGDNYLYMYYSPLEDNPEFTHWNALGSIYSNFDSINDEIVTISARYEDYIFISALCTLDFPAPHTFTFPAPTVYDNLPVITFSHEDQLFMISDGVLYAFTVDFSVSNADATAVPPLHTLSAYPNPASLKGVITFNASIKQALELDIYNVKGQRVDTITLDSEGTAEWDLRNHKGAALSAGVYLAKPRNHKDIKPVKFIATH